MAITLRILSRQQQRPPWRCPGPGSLVDLLAATTAPRTPPRPGSAPTSRWLLPTVNSRCKSSERPRGGPGGGPGGGPDGGGPGGGPADSDSGRVVELTEDTFRDFVQARSLAGLRPVSPPAPRPCLRAEPVVLVLYHAPWCEHCEKVRPEWDRAAALLRDQGVSSPPGRASLEVNTAAVLSLAPYGCDMDRHRCAGCAAQVRGRLAAVDTSRPGLEDLALAQGVQQLPSMRLYVRGQLQARHLDVRQADAIVQLVREAAARGQGRDQQDHLTPLRTTLPRGPTALHLHRGALCSSQGPLLRLGRDQLKPFLSKKKHAFVLYYRPGESDDSDRVAESFERVSAALGSATSPSAALVAVDCAEQPVLCEAMLPSSPNLPVIKYYHFLDRAGAVCDDQLQGSDIARFLSARTAATQVGGGGGSNGNGGGQNPQDSDGAAYWANVQHRDAVVLLNDASFDEMLQRSGRVLVFFYAPWCNYCSSIKQSYATAAKQLAESGFAGCMAAVDYSSNPLLERRFRLEFLPAFKLFNKGAFVEDHNKLRTQEEFVNLMDSTLRHK
ncbi:Protein disulfide-isomerase A5 [Frankliniella fusca]|uniref:Protein disulfide-isomerase A5 n=1 Tax=Frankliniella fusca TaxID=407009 RepID=A0AAE1GWX2_9NEOP|nr:Protein disulfide-isomerase A5 [Frankliniella fusca]